MEVVPSDCSASSHALLGPAFSYPLSWCCTAGKLKQLSFIPTASLWPPDRSKLMPACGAPTVHSKKFHQMTPFPTSLHIPTLASLCFSQTREVNQPYSTAAQWGNQAVHQNHWNIQNCHCHRVLNVPTLLQGVTETTTSPGFSLRLNTDYQEQALLHLKHVPQETGKSHQHVPGTWMNK